MIWPEQVIDFARKPGVHAGFPAVWDSRFGRPVILSTTRFAVGESDEPAARRSKGRPDFARLSRRSSTYAIRCCGLRGRSTGIFWRDASVRYVGWDPGSR